MSRARALLAVTLVLAALEACRRTGDGDHAAIDRQSLTTHTRSDSLPTPEARVSFLGRYLRLRSSVRDAAFIIDYHDNSAGLLPGPSDWSVLAALRLPPGAMASWLESAQPCEQPADPAFNKIVPTTWEVSSKPRCLMRDRSTLIVHAPEAVLVFFAEAH